LVRGTKLFAVIHFSENFELAIDTAPPAISPQPRSFSFEVTESPLEYQEDQYATNSETQLGASRRFNVTGKEY
jgi:hypothetical protein